MTGSGTPCVSIAMPGDAGPVGGRWIEGVVLLRGRLIHPQLFQLVPQRPERNPQLRRRPRLVPAVLFQRLLDGSALHLFDVGGQGAIAVVKKRYWDMRQDGMDLFTTRPTGKMSWAGHQQQFRSWQVNLRGYLEVADAMNCKDYPSDAWEWATKPVPTQPAPR